MSVVAACFRANLELPHRVDLAAETHKLAQLHAALLHAFEVRV